MLSDVKNHETEKIILFDHLVNNYDRHNGNLLCDISSGATLYIIDNSHIITEEPRKVFILEEALSQSYVLSNTILKSNMEIYNLLCCSVGYEIIEQLFQVLFNRRSLLCEMAEMIIEERRKL